jgi:pre-mRNA-splicing factor SYF1
MAEAADWEAIGEDVLRETDVAYEQELQQNPYSVKLWFAYVKAKKGADHRVRFLIYERAAKELPGSYKIWRAYLQERLIACRELCITDPLYEATNNAFDRALVFLHKMPRIWLDYIEFLMKQKKISRARRALDDALRCLPITQHARIWELYVKFIKEGEVPKETALCAFRRYLMLEPDHVEVYIAYLRTIGRYDEAAQKLSNVVDDEDFSSMEGKTRHQLWMDLCDLVSKHPADIKSLNIEAIIRSGIRQFTDEVGRLWISLGDHFIRLGQFEKARDVYEEAMSTVSTVHDFSLIFDAYSKFLESLVTAHMERETAPGAATEIDLLMARLEDLLARRPELVSSVKLRQNPHNVHEWLQRAKLYKDTPEKVIRCFTEAVMTVDPQKAEGRLWTLWAAFAKFYESHDDLENARIIFDKATKVNFRGVDDLASAWCEWIEMELRHREYDLALKVARQAVGQKKASALRTDKDVVQNRIYRSTKLWSLCADLEESLGTTESTRATYDAAIELKVSTPSLILSYARFLEDRKYFEDAFKVYERGIKVFNWPHVNDIWLTYLNRFVGRYGGRKLERARDLFEQAVEKVPAKYARRLHMLYAKLEEEHGLARHALAIYNRATTAVEEADMYEMYSILLRKTAELFGQTRTREIYEKAIEVLPQDRIKDACMRYAKMETMLGEVDRSRAIYNHAAQFCDPRKEDEFWKTWRSFEVQHGNEDTFRDMLRIKRSVQATYAQVHFNATDIAAESGPEVLDPMQEAEKELKSEEERKRGGGALGGDSKRSRATTDAGTARKELLGGFQPADYFQGARPGFVFKVGLKGCGYYEDASVSELERRASAKVEEEKRAAIAERRAAAAENPEEIELDMTSMTRRMSLQLHLLLPELPTLIQRKSS